jgi:hypothetical protein
MLFLGIFKTMTEECTKIQAAHDAAAADAAAAHAHGEELAGRLAFLEAEKAAAAAAWAAEREELARRQARAEVDAEAARSAAAEAVAARERAEQSLRTALAGPEMEVLRLQRDNLALQVSEATSMLL